MKDVFCLCDLLDLYQGEDPHIQVSEHGGM